MTTSACRMWTCSRSMGGWWNVDDTGSRHTTSAQMTERHSSHKLQYSVVLTELSRLPSPSSCSSPVVLLSAVLILHHHITISPFPITCTPHTLHVRVHSTSPYAAHTAVQLLLGQQRQRATAASVVGHSSPPSPAAASAMPSGGSQTLASTPPTPSAVKAVPFTFLGHSLHPTPASSPSSSSLLTKSTSSPAPVAVACPRSCRLLCFLQLSFPASLRRLAVRNQHAAFIAVHATADLQLLRRAWEQSTQVSELNDGRVHALLHRFVQLLPCRQLCPLDVWASPEPAPALSKVHSLKLPPTGCPIFAASSSSTVVGLCLELRGAEDYWRPDALLGVQWLELFGEEAAHEQG